MLFYSYNSMTNAARNGARSLAVQSATKPEVITAVKASLPGWIPAAKITVVPDTTTAGAGQVNTRITVPSSSATVLPFGPMPDMLDVTVTMKTQT